jgi:hypothetical protein
MTEREPMSPWNAGLQPRAPQSNDGCNTDSNDGGANDTSDGKLDKGVVGK